jgi:hypothetical protein
LVTLIADKFLPKQASNITSYGKTNNILLDKEWNNQQIKPIMKEGKHH